MERGPGGGSGGDSAGDPLSSPDLVEESISLVRQGLSRLRDARLWTRSDAQARDLVDATLQLTAQVQAAYLAAVRDLDTRPDAVPGARAGDVAKTYLIHRGRVSPAQANTDLTAARATDPDNGHLPALGAALADGQASRAHVDVAAKALHRIPQRILTAVDDHGTPGARKIDAFLTEHARQLCPRTIDHLATRLLDVLDPTRTDRYDPDAYTRRRLSSATDTTGMLVGRFQLDPAGGAALKAALDLHAAPTPTTSDGQQTLISDDRTPGQRYADALVAIARQAPMPRS
jgi:hypothetical protein